MALNFIYCCRIALELNLNIAIMTNFVELIHIGSQFFALAIFFYSMQIKRANQQVDEGPNACQGKFTCLAFENHTIFPNMGLLTTFDAYSILFINLGILFYPFRFFLFIARFKISSLLSAHLNTIVRTTPGIFVFLACVAIIFSGFAFCSMMLFQEYIPHMGEFLPAFKVNLTEPLLQKEIFQKTLGHSDSNQLEKSTA